MEAIDIDHDLVVVDEFDALSIEVNSDNVAELEAKAEEPPKKYPAKQHARKVAKELGTDTGLIYLPGQLESTWEDSDQGPPFRQRRYFYYLTGADFPGCSVTYDIAADKLTLWVPFTPPATVLWFGNTPSPSDCLARSDVHDVKYVGELPAYLAARLSTVKTLYALRPSQLPKFDGFDRLRPNIRVDVSSLQPAMDEARLIKSDYEVAMIRKAGDVSAAAHRKVAALVCGMKNECEIEAAFVSACAAANAKTQAYPVIAGSGTNASTLHYAANNESLAGRQLVVLDAGAEWSCYGSELTRTLPLSRSRFTTEARAIYNLVHRMQEECLQRVKPGVVFRDLQLHATRVAVEGLLELGILKGGTVDEILRNGTGAAFFPHGLGHHVGLDVHDVLSRDLLRPAGEGMWGKRRPIGPQSVRAMVKQAASEAAPSSPATSTSSGSAPTQPSTPPLPPKASASPVPKDAATTPQPGSPASTPPSSPSKSQNGSANGNADKPSPPERKQSLANPPEQPQPQLQQLPQSPPPQLSQLPQILITAQPGPRPNTPQQLQPQHPKAGKNRKSSAAAAVSSKRPPHSTLQPGMVVTIEPGLYFSRPYVEAYFLRRAEHARYVDAEALDRFWGVGGVRVEDCVLVTGVGCEVLTAGAPKGDEMLKLMGYA